MSTSPPLVHVMHSAGPVKSILESLDQKTIWDIDQIRHKPASTSKEDGKRLLILDFESRGIVLSVLRKQRR